MNDQSTVLVTGGAGFMGSHVVEAILQERALGSGPVVVVDDLSGGCRDHVPSDPRVEFVQGDINDSALVATLFERHRFRFVYHLAAYAAEGLSHFIRRFNYGNNLLASVNLINAAINHGSECFVFTSSIAVYGDAPSPLRESTPPRPVDPYGIAKYAVELDLAAALATHGLRHVIFRPHNVYGERQNLADPYRNVVGIFMNKLLHGEPMPVFGDGTQRRAFTYVRDVSPAIARAPLNPAAINGTFNLGSDTHHSVNELADQVRRAMGVDGETSHLPARHEVHVAYSDHTRARETFPELTDTPLEEGLARMAAWAKTATIPQPQSFEPLEVERALPPSWRSTRNRSTRNGGVKRRRG